VRKHTLMASLVGLTVALSGFARADDQPIETQVVDALNKAFGAHPGFRANHAKGLVVEGLSKRRPRQRC
jgi:catalase